MISGVILILVRLRFRRKIHSWQVPLRYPDDTLFAFADFCTSSGAAFVYEIGEKRSFQVSKRRGSSNRRDGRRREEWRARRQDIWDAAPEFEIKDLLTTTSEKKGGSVQWNHVLATAICAAR